MGGGVHIDFNLDFLSADPTSNSAKRTLFGHSRAAMPGAMPTWYGRFRQYAVYEIGHLVLYADDSDDFLSRNERSAPSLSNLYVCVNTNRAGDFPPPSSTAWRSLRDLSSDYNTGARSVPRSEFLNSGRMADDEICLNLFEFIDLNFIICNSTFTPLNRGADPIAIKPRVGASFGGGVTRTRREIDLDSSQGGNLERFTVDYPDYAISGTGQIPLPSRKFGFAATSLNAQMGAEIEALNPTNDPLDPDLSANSFDSSLVYEVGSVVNYFPIADGQTLDSEVFDTTNHPKLSVCIKNLESPARSQSGTYDTSKLPWNQNSTYWRSYTSASNRPNSSLSSVYEYLVNKKNRFPAFTVNPDPVKNLSNQTVIRNKSRIRMNDFGGTSNIYGHFFVHWATALKPYSRSKCRTWYSGASSQSGPHQDGQYDIFIYTKNLKKDHGGQPRLAVTFGKTTSIKFLSVSGVSTFSTGTISSNTINKYLKDDNFDSSMIQEVSSEADIMHYQYSNLVPSYFMGRGYVHSRRRGGVHPGSNKGDLNLGKFILFIEDLLSRQRIEMVTPQIFSNGNPRLGLHGHGIPTQDWGETGATRNYEYTKQIVDGGGLTDLLSTKTTATTAVQPMHYLILGNALSSTDQVANQGISFQNRFVDRAFRPIMIRTDALSEERFFHILGLMQTGFTGVDAELFKNITEQNIDNLSGIENKIWMDLGETFHGSQGNPLFKSIAAKIGSFKENTLTNLNDLASWSSSSQYSPQQITKITHSDYWAAGGSQGSANFVGPWYYDVQYVTGNIVYLWQDGQKTYYTARASSKSISPKEFFTFYRASVANSNKTPIYNSDTWRRVSIPKSNIGFLKGFVSTINPYTSLQVLANSTLWPPSGRRAAKIGFGWKRTLSEEGILNQITESNQESYLSGWIQGAEYQAGDIITVQSGPIVALAPDGEYYTYEQWVSRFNLSTQEEEEVSLLFSEAEAVNPLYAFKCLKSTAEADVNDPKSYVGLIPGFIPNETSSEVYYFLSNLDSEQDSNDVISENIVSQTIWKDISSTEWNNGSITSSKLAHYGLLESQTVSWQPSRILSAADVMEAYNLYMSPHGFTGSSSDADGGYWIGKTWGDLKHAMEADARYVNPTGQFNKRDVFGAGTYAYDLSFEPYYKVGDAVVMRQSGVDVYKLKIKAFHLIDFSLIPAGYTDGGSLESVARIKPNYYYSSNINLTGSSVENYSSTSTFHGLIRSQWWQPVAKRTGTLERGYPDVYGNTGSYFVVPKSFDFLHLEDGIAEVAQQATVDSTIKVYFDEVKTFDLRGTQYYWTNEVKNISSNMINALPSSGTEAELEPNLVAELDHPYIDFNVFGASWDDGASTVPNLLQTSATGHEAVEYFKSWLYSSFDVQLARDFGEPRGSSVNIDAILSSKFEFVKYYSFYNPTVTLKYQICDSSNNPIGNEIDYVEGSEIEIQKGQRIKLMPKLIKDDNSEISTFSLMCNSFARNNTIGLFLRTPLDSNYKEVDFSYTYVSSSVSEPPIDSDGIRIPYYTNNEIVSGQTAFPVQTAGAYSATADQSKTYQSGNIVSYGAKTYEFYVLDSDWEFDADIENNPEIAPGRWHRRSWKNPVTLTYGGTAPENTHYRTSEGFFRTTEAGGVTTSAETITPTFSSSAFALNTNLQDLLFNSSIVFGPYGQNLLLSSIDQAYEEVAIKETLLSRFYKSQTLHDQYGEAGSAEQKLLSSAPKWRNVSGPEGSITENEITGIDWSANNVYAQGEIVEFGNKFYIATRINSAVDPSSEPSEWKIVQPWHQDNHYIPGDFVYIFEDELILSLDSSGNPLPTLRENIQLKGPSSVGNNSFIYPSWSKHKYYHVGEKLIKNSQIYRCIAAGVVSTELEFNQNFQLTSEAVPAHPDYGGKYAFFVCEKNVSPGDGGHNPRRLNVLTSMHGDDDILIRASDNLSKAFNQNDDIYLDFTYQNGDAFQVSTKNISLSMFGYNSSSTIDERDFLTQINSKPEIAEAHASTLSAWSTGSEGEGFVSTGTLNIKVKVTNPSPSSVIDRSFTPATPPSDSTSQTFASYSNLLCSNKFLINNGRLYASGLDSSELGFIGLMDNSEFQNTVLGNSTEGSQHRSYNKFWTLEGIGTDTENHRVKIFENGSGGISSSDQNEIISNDQSTFVNSEGGNTVFICGGKLYGMGHNQGYSLGLCADSSSTFGLGNRSQGYRKDGNDDLDKQRKSEAVQDFFEASLHFDSDYYINLQVKPGSTIYSLGDSQQQFSTDMSTDLVAWNHFTKKGFYQSINDEWSLMGYTKIDAGFWGSTSSQISQLTSDWFFVEPYNSNSWISHPGSMEATVLFTPNYMPSNFWQMGGIHAYNLDQKTPAGSWGVMYLANLDAYFESSIFERMDKLIEDEDYFDAWKNNMAQYKYVENSSVYHGTVDTSSGSQPRLGWNGILVNENSLKRFYDMGDFVTSSTWMTQMRIGRTVAVAGEIDGTNSGLKENTTHDNGDASLVAVSSPKYNYYNNSDTYGYDGSMGKWTKAFTHNKSLYINGKPFWDPVLGESEHIVIDSITGEYNAGSSGSNNRATPIGIYKLNSEKNISFGNYPRNTRLESDLQTIIPNNLGISNLPGGGRNVDGLANASKEIIPARTYVPYATKLTDENVTWAATNKYSTFYINDQGQVKALGSVCACPFYKIQGLSIPQSFELTPGGDFGGLMGVENNYSSPAVSIDSFDAFGSLTITAAEESPVFKNDNWALILSEAGTNSSSNLHTHAADVFGGDDIYFGSDSSEYIFRDQRSQEIIIESQIAASYHDQNLLKIMYDDSSYKISANAWMVRFTEKGAGSNGSDIFSDLRWYATSYDHSILVRAMYLLVLRREVDATGLSHYTGQNHYGINMTLYQMIGSLMLSAEFISNDAAGLTKQYVIDANPESLQISNDPRDCFPAMKKMMKIWNHYGNTSFQYWDGDSNMTTSHMLRISPEYIGAIVINNCEREEVNGIYRPSKGWDDNDFNSTADESWYNHAHNQGGRDDDKGIYVSDKNTQYGKILIYWDANLDIWRMQYSDFWLQDTTGDGLRVQRIIGMQKHYYNANGDLVRSTKSNIGTPQDVDEWYIGTGEWLTATVPETVDVFSQPNDFIDSTRVIYAPPSGSFINNNHGPTRMAIVPKLLNKTEGSEDPDTIFDNMSYAQQFNNFGSQIPSGGASAFVDDDLYKLDQNIYYYIKRFTDNGRAFSPVHFADRFASMTRPGGLQALRPDNNEVYTRINTGLDWNLWPEDVDFVNEFSPYEQAIGNLLHFQGGALKETLIYTSLDTKAGANITNDGLDVWRFNLTENSNVTFKTKIFKNSGSFSDPSKVKFGMYIFKDNGYGSVNIADFQVQWPNSGLPGGGISDWAPVNTYVTPDRYSTFIGGGETAALADYPDLFTDQYSLVKAFFARYYRPDNYVYSDADPNYNSAGTSGEQWTINGDIITNRGLNWSQMIDVRTTLRNADDHFFDRVMSSNFEHRIIFPGVTANSFNMGTGNPSGGSYVSLDANSFLDNEMVLDVSINNAGAGGYYVLLVAEHDFDAPVQDLQLIQSEYNINTTVVATTGAAEPMFTSEAITEHINGQDPETNEPITNADTKAFTKDPLKYIARNSWSYNDYSGFISMLEVYDWHADLTDWQYYFDSQDSGLEQAIRDRPSRLNMTQADVGLTHWNSNLTLQDRKNRSAHIRGLFEKRFSAKATYFRGFESMNHNADWVYDEIFGWSTKAIGTHSPANNGVSSIYTSSAGYYFSSRYNNWFELSSSDKIKRDNGEAFAIKFLNHDFNFNLFIEGQSEFNLVWPESNSATFTYFDANGQMNTTTGFRKPVSNAYSQLDQYSYNTGDVAKIELAEGNDLFRTLYFVSLKDNNTSSLGFLDSLVQDEIKEFNIPARKGLNQRYAVETHTLSSDTSLSGPITIYDPADYNNDKAVRVDMGESHAIIITESGKAYGVGDNSQKQIDKIFERSDQFNGLNQDSPFGSNNYDNCLYLVANKFNPISPYLSRSDWDTIEKPAFPLERWKYGRTYNNGEEVFIKNETYSVIAADDYEVSELKKSNILLNAFSGSPYLVDHERFFDSGESRIRNETIFANTIGELFKRNWNNGRNVSGGIGNRVAVYAGKIDGITHDTSLKNHYRESRGDGFFLTQDCYLNPHEIKSFFKQGSVVNNLFIKNIKCSGYGSLFLDSSNNLYGIGNNEISKSSKSQYAGGESIGTVFGLNSDFDYGPEFIKESVSFMHKTGDLVSYISHGYSYKAGGQNLYPYFENYQNAGAEAIMLGSDGNPIVAKMVFMEGPRFWDNRDWFLKRSLSQKINNNFYLKDENYKPVDLERCTPHTRKGQFTSNVFGLPTINDFIPEWKDEGQYHELIKCGQIMGSDKNYLQNEREDDPSWFKSVETYGALSSAFESKQPSLVTYQGKIYQCIQRHGHVFGDEASDKIPNDRNLNKKFTVDSEGVYTARNRVGAGIIPGASGSELYWQEVSDLSNKNMIQFLTQRLKIFNLSSMIVVSEDNNLYIKGFNFGLSKESDGTCSGIKDNSELIAFERGADVGSNSPEQRLIVEKYFKDKYLYRDLSSAYLGFNTTEDTRPTIPKWKSFVNLMSEKIEGWTHPNPVNETGQSTLSGGRSLSPFDFLGNNRKRGQYFVGIDSSEYIDVENLSLELNPAAPMLSWGETNSALNDLLSNNVFGFLESWTEVFRAMEDWKQGVSAHYRQPRPFMFDGSFSECLNLSWTTVDPFVNSLFLSYRGAYQPPIEIEGTSTDFSNLNSIVLPSSIDLSTVSININTRNAITSLEPNQKNFGFIMETTADLSGARYNSFYPELLRSPSPTLFNWWDLIRDAGSKLKNTVLFDTSEAAENPSAEFSFMELFFSQHSPSAFPVSNSSEFVAKPHISESNNPWSDRNSNSFYNPWGSCSFVNNISNQTQWHIQDNAPTLQSFSVWNSRTNNIHTPTLREDVSSLQSVVDYNYNQSLYADFYSTYLNAANNNSTDPDLPKFVELTEAFKQLQFFDTASHYAFFVNSYLLDPASLPFGDTIPKFGYQNNNGSITSAASYNVGERVFYKGFSFTSLLDSNSSTPSFGDAYCASPISDSNWRYEEPMDLHRFRSQIGISHGISISRLIMNKRNDEDPYVRAAFISQQTIGHSQIDFSFVSKNPSMTNFHNFKNLNLLRRADWEQTDQHNKLPYEHLENKTHPLAEGEDVNADPLLSQSSNKKGFNLPDWFRIRSQHISEQTALLQAAIDTAESNQGGSWASNFYLKLWVNVLIERFMKAYGYKDQRLISRPDLSLSGVGEDINWNSSQASVDDDFDFITDNVGEYPVFDFTPDLANGELGGFAKPDGLADIPFIIDGNLRRGIPSTEENLANNVSSIVPTSNGVDYGDLGRAYNAAFKGYDEANYFYETSVPNTVIKNVYYKFAKPAFPALYGNITDYMEAISEMHKYGFSNFTSGSDLTSTIWGREINHDFYCSSKINSQFYASNIPNYLEDKTPSGGASRFDCDDNYITESEDDFNTAFDNSKCYFSVNADYSGFATVDGAGENDNSIYIRNRKKFFESLSLASSYDSNGEPERNTHSVASMVTKYLHGLRIIYELDGVKSKENIKYIDNLYGYRFSSGDIYLIFNQIYFCKKDFDAGTSTAPINDRVPRPGLSNDAFEFVVSLQPTSPTVPFQKLYDKNLNEINDKWYYFEDFPHAVKNLRHLRFEIRKIYPTSTNIHGEDQLFPDVNTPDANGNPISILHQGFLNHGSSEALGNHAYVLSGGLAGLVFSDYFDAFKEGSSFYGNRAYRSDFKLGDENTSVHTSAIPFSIPLQDEDTYFLTEQQAKNAAEKYVIYLAKEREGLDYVWFDSRDERWVVGRNWIHEKIETNFDSESEARSRAQALGYSDQSLICWEKEYFPCVYKEAGGAINKDLDKFIEHDVIYIGGKEHHQCLARIHGVTEKWKQEIESNNPGFIEINNGQLFFALLGTLTPVSDWAILTNITFDIS